MTAAGGSSYDSRLPSEITIMNSSSIRCTVSIRPTIPLPLPNNLTAEIHEIEVVQRDKERSGFKIEFYAGRQNTTTNTLDYSILQSPQIQIFNRVNILVSFNNNLPQLLMDGIVTDIQLQNTDAPGESKITL